MGESTRAPLYTASRDGEIVALSNSESIVSIIISG